MPGDTRRRFLQTATSAVLSAWWLQQNRATGSEPRRRRVYLRRLEQSLRATIDAGGQISQRQQFLGGLLAIEHLYVIDDDLVLEGPATDDWQVYQGHTALAKSDGLPLLCVDDLVLALRNVYSGGPAPMLSLEPRRESLQAVRAVLQRFGIPQDRAAVRRLEEEIRRVWGPQDAILQGVPRQSRFALVMTYADWEMKRLSLGLRAAGPVQLTPYVDLEFADYKAAVLRRGARAKPPAMGSRFWFMASDEPFVRTPDRKAFAFPRRPVRLATEGYFRSRTFARVDVQPTPAAERFAASFTERYDQLAANLAIYHDLRNLFHLVALAKLIKEQQIAEQIGWNLEFWLRHYPVRKVSVPEQMPGLAVVRWDTVQLPGQQVTARLFFPAWGGVHVGPEARVAD